MGSSTKNQKVRSDNRRMTGNVNIYICSEAVEKNEKNAEENVTQTTATSGSSTSLISEKSRQKVGPIEEHLASPNRVRKKLAAKPAEKQNNDTVKKEAAKDSDIIDHEKLISTTEFNKFTSYESKFNPTAGEIILKNSNEPREHKINSDSTRYDRSKLVSCRCPQFDESDLWLQKALKRQNRDSTVIAPSYNVKKADPNEQRSAEAQKNLGKSERMDKKCTCDRNEKHDCKGNEACDQLCTCCSINVHKKENTNGSKSKKIDKNQTSEFKKETSKSSHDKKESSLGKKDEKIAKNQTQHKVTNSKDDSKDYPKDPKENLKTKKSNSPDIVIKEEKSNDSIKKRSKERLQPIESESNKKSKKDLENVQKPQKKSKLSIKEKTNKEKSNAKEKPQEVKLQSKEKKKKITKEKKSTKTKDRPTIKKDSENKSSEPSKSDKVEAPDSAKTKKKKEKKTKLVFTDANEKSTVRKAINDRKEDSFLSKLINMMKSNKKVSRTDAKKRGRCSPDCTGLTKTTDTSTKNKSKREKSGQKPKSSSGTIISNGSNNIPEKFHDFKSTSDTQVNDTVVLNSRAKSVDDEKSVPLLEKTDDTVDKTFSHSKAEDKNEQFCYYDNRVGRYPSETTKMKTKDNDVAYSRLKKNCSCYDCLRESEAACDQFSFSNSYPHEAYFEKSIESCCECKSQRPVMNFEEDHQRCFNDLQDYPLVATNKLGRRTKSAHCCWCSCRDSV